MTLTSDSETTHDAFLGGRLTLEQPAKGYRAGVDPVLLAACVPAIQGQSVLELGCGTGAALLCLGHRVPFLTLHGVEVQPRYADLSRKNAAANSIDARIWTADLTALPADVQALSFDHVIANPPYFDRSRGNASPQADRDIAFAGATPMTAWIDTATRRLKPKGWLTLIQKADRLPEVLSAFDSRMGSIAVYPITGRTGRPADRFILRARKGGRGAFRLCAATPLHAGQAHLADAEDYTPEISGVLRNGWEFRLPD